MQDLVIFGSKYPDLIKLVGAINRTRMQWRLLGFIDDRAEAQGTHVLGFPILGTRADLQQLADAGAQFFSNVTGSLAAARSVALLLESLGRPMPSLIHPHVELDHVQCGHGCVLQHASSVGSGARIGNYLAARLGVIISHDVSIGDHVFIGPGAVVGGGAKIEDGAFIGAGATVMPGRRVGAAAMVGAGALVTADVPSNTTVMGVPGRVVEPEGRP